MTDEERAYFANIREAVLWNPFCADKRTDADLDQEAEAEDELEAEL
jgi:hypothetical protein